MLKKADIIFLVNIGVTTATTHSLSAEHAYKFLKFRRALSSAFEDIWKEEEELMKESGIENAEEFNKKLSEARKAGNAEELEERLNRYNGLKDEMLKQEITLDGVKAMPYDEWHKLQNENQDKEFAGAKRDLFFGYAEDVLENVLWIAPED